MERNPYQHMPAGLQMGLTLYMLRGIAVLIYAYWCPSAIGGPQVNAEHLGWLPFFVADFPWSFIFLSFEYPSNLDAVVVYLFLVGIPWIGYGWLIQRRFGQRHWDLGFWMALAALAAAAIGPLVVTFESVYHGRATNTETVNVSLFTLFIYTETGSPGTINRVVTTLTPVLMGVFAIVGAGFAAALFSWLCSIRRFRIDD